MSRNSTWNKVLPLVAVLALLAYLLACRPSWSPDGSRVAFVCALSDEALGVAVYDLKAKSSKLLPLGHLKPAGVFLRPQWSRDGKTLLVVFSPKDNEKGAIAVVPAEAPERARVVAAITSADFLSAAFPEVDGKLYLGGKRITQVDLARGLVKEKDVNDVVVLAASCRGIVALYSYLEKEGTVLAHLDPATLALKPFLTLKSQDVGEVSPFYGVSDDGTQIALVARKGNEKRLHLVAQDKVARTIPLSFPANQGLTSLEWSRDGKTLAGTLVTTDRTKRQLIFQLCEIVIASGKVTNAPIGTLAIKEADKDEDPSIGIRGALSPDGKSFAVATTFVPGAAEPKQGVLYLVDLASPQRTVTRIRPPAP
jgi:hypothetical protein